MHTTRHPSGSIRLSTVKPLSVYLRNTQCWARWNIDHKSIIGIRDHQIGPIFSMLFIIFCCFSWKLALHSNKDSHRADTSLVALSIHRPAHARADGVRSEECAKSSSIQSSSIRLRRRETARKCCSVHIAFFRLRHSLSLCVFALPNGLHSARAPFSDCTWLFCLFAMRFALVFHFLTVCKFKCFLKMSALLAITASQMELVEDSWLSFSITKLIRWCMLWLPVKRPHVDSAAGWKWSVNS